MIYPKAPPWVSMVKPLICSMMRGPDAILRAHRDAQHLLAPEPKWGFAKLGVPYWGPYNKDYSRLGSILGSPHFVKLPNISVYQVRLGLGWDVDF